MQLAVLHDVPQHQILTMSTLVSGVVHPPEPTDVPMEATHPKLASLDELCADCTFGDVRISWSIEEKKLIRLWRDQFVQTFGEANPLIEGFRTKGYR